MGGEPAAEEPVAEEPVAEGPAAAEAVTVEPKLTELESGVEVLLQAVSVVDRDVVWISGHGGTWLRTLDGGATWESGRVPDADSLQFRDVHAAGRDTALLLSAGSGEASRIYRTRDGGRSWELRWTNREPEGFYDCMDFWDEDVGAVYGDAVGGELRVLRTRDGGGEWRLLPPEALPEAQPGEGGFAASGTCLRAGADGAGWIATGAAPVARVLRTADSGRTWSAHPTAVVAGESAGLTTLSFVDERDGLALGGRLGDPEDTLSVNVARTVDGGRTWTAAGRTALPGAVYGSDGSAGAGYVAVGPAGADWSPDGGRSWRPLRRGVSYWAVGIAELSAGGGAIGWMVGPGGRITRIDFR